MKSLRRCVRNETWKVRRCVVNRMKIAIRLDDITKDMDWPKFLRMKAILDKHGIKPLIGVVPDNQDPLLVGSSEGCPEDFAGYIKGLQDDGWVVAMHGLTHVYTTKSGGMFPLNDFSEFAGLPYEEQYELLSYGKQILNDTGVTFDIFMAPGHSYDRNTLKALRELEITKITDGFGNNPYEFDGMTFYPISDRRSKVIKSNNDGYSTFVYHTNTMTEKNFEELEKMLDSHNSEGPGNVTDTHSNEGPGNVSDTHSNEGPGNASDTHSNESTGNVSAVKKFISYTEYLECPPVKQTFSGRIVE